MLFILFIYYTFHIPFYPSVSQQLGVYPIRIALRSPEAEICLQGLLLP
jgi:hypothetical protein